MHQEHAFVHGFNVIHGVGHGTLSSLISFFGTYQKAWHATQEDFRNAGVHPRVIDAIIEKRPAVNIEQELENIARQHIALILPQDKHYPPQLKEIPKPPAALYVRGLLTPLEQSATLAIVGTRRATPYGREATTQIASELSREGIAIISGLAIGIDTYAHHAALEQSGNTIAIIGSGIDPESIYPAQNKSLAQRIIRQGGAVLSEYPPGMPPSKEHFPQRNRIISGLSGGTVVIEARERSGALITARLALEQNRDVFAVPGSIFSPASAGPNALICEGATPVRTARDILQALGRDERLAHPRASAPHLTEYEQAVCDQLDHPTGVDEIKHKTKLDTPTIITILSKLELSGLARNMGEDTYQKT